MNVKILYTTNCAITIHFCEGHELASAEWGHHCNNPDSATGIVIWDGNTGEVLAEIKRDE